MRTLHSHRKHRRHSLVTFALSSVVVGVYTLLTVSGLVAMVVGQRTGMALLLLIMTCAGAWGLFWHMRFFLRTPIDVSILDSGLVQFRMRRGEEIVSPDAFKIAVSTDTGAVGHLRLRTATTSWYLPSTADEAEELIRTMTSLNPNIRVKRKEESHH